ncbi:hypothetical protein OS493_034880 [Desmophyllum pertusum]|uniref:Uncharacterized protein n=1 Tax=Desmophyllum pertusum TaxID=174260 RepID=A0A9W9ZIM8_9CNID|nr:hypothetical protein OS493_034880 [Desmophyllum pertusum]
MELHSGCTYNITISVTDGVKFDFCSVVLRVVVQPDTQVQTGGFPKKWTILIVVVIILFLVLVCLVSCFFRLVRKQWSEHLRTSTDGQSVWIECTVSEGNESRAYKTVEFDECNEQTVKETSLL